MMMNRMQLAQWLGEADSESVAFSEIAELLHLVLDASRRSLALASADELREVRFALAVLRDVFPHDDDVRAWLSAPAPDLTGATPADLLSTGRIREFVDLAVTEWNRPGAYRLSRQGTMFVSV
jgi:uncharacterized protein (DUF2384 family)